MTDMRLKPRTAKHQSVECGRCGDRVWREDGFTKAEAAAWDQNHRRDECPAVDNYTKAHREGLF